MNEKNTNLPPYINISTMAKLMNLSRSRLYQLVEQRVLLKAVYLLNNKRPVYTREMAVRNLEVKNSNVGINGEIVMFYSARNASIQTPKKIIKKPAEQTTGLSKHTEIIDALESLGLENITSSKIDTAIRDCFPDGTENVTDDYILTEVFRHLNCRNSEHKPRT